MSGDTRRYLLEELREQTAMLPNHRPHSAANLRPKGLDPLDRSLTLPPFMKVSSKTAVRQIQRTSPTEMFGDPFGPLAVSSSSPRMGTPAAGNSSSSPRASALQGSPRFVAPATGTPRGSLAYSFAGSPRESLYTPSLAGSPRGNAGSLAGSPRGNAGSLAGSPRGSVADMRTGSPRGGPPGRPSPTQKDDELGGALSLMDVLRRTWDMVTQRIADGKGFSEGEIEMIQRIKGSVDPTSSPVVTLPEPTRKPTARLTPTPSGSALRSTTPPSPLKTVEVCSPISVPASPGSPKRSDAGIPVGRRRSFGDGRTYVSLNRRPSGLSIDSTTSPAMGRRASLRGMLALQHLKETPATASGAQEGGATPPTPPSPAEASPRTPPFLSKLPHHQLSPRSPRGCNSPSKRSFTKIKSLLLGEALRSKGIFSRMLELMVKLSSIPVSELNAKQPHIARAVADLLQVEQCTFWFIDDTLGTLVAQNADGSESRLDLEEDADAAAAMTVRAGEPIGAGAPGTLRRGLSDCIRCREEWDSEIYTFLAVPIMQDSRLVGAAEARNKFVVRGVTSPRGGRDCDRELAPSFSDDDVRLFEAMVMFIAVLQKNTTLFTIAKHQQTKAEAMLEMAGQLASAYLNQNTLIPQIMEAARKLTQSDKSSLFVVDESTKELVAFFQGQRTRVRIPLGSGIAGHVATTGEPVNITDAYTHPMFNAEVDRATGYRTRTMLCMPVVYEGTVVAVSQLINKLAPDGSVTMYTQEDEELFQTFAAFAGVCLRNCKEHLLLQQALSRNNIIMEAATRLTACMAKPHEVIRTVIYGAKKLSNADRCSVFLVDKERHQLVLSASDSSQDIRLSIGLGIAGTVCLTGVPLNIPDAYADPRFNPVFDRETGYVTKTILCFPVFAETIQGSREVVAVSQLINKLDEVTGEVVPFTSVDEDNARQFALFAGVSIMNSQMFQHAVSAHEDAMQLVVTRNTPRTLSGTALHRVGVRGPVDSEAFQHILSLRPKPSEVLEFKSVDFNIHTYRQDPERSGLVVPLLASLFHDLGYVQKFNIPPDVLLRFIATVQTMYRSVPYHNFFHAADVTQTLYTFLSYGKMAELFDDLSCFVLLVTAIVHDIDHMGLNNSFHFKAETPMGILSSLTGSTSVLEVHHCNLTVEILGRPETDIFSGLNEEQKKAAYRLLIDNILATDMAQHKSLSEYATSLYKDKGYVKSDPEHAKLLMQHLLKSADISNITKPFEVSRRWAIAVTEEFHQQGDREKELGQQVMPMFDREAQQALAKGQVGFIDFVGRPHFKFMESIVPSFKHWVDNLENNAKQWKSQLDALERHSSARQLKK